MSLFQKAEGWYNSIPKKLSIQSLLLLGFLLLQIIEMDPQNKKELQSSASTPFLLRFSGKVSQINKQGTFSNQFRSLIAKPAHKSKTALTMVQRKADNILLDLSEVKRKNDINCSQTFETKDVLLPCSRIGKSMFSEEKPKFYIDSALPGNISMSMDFKDMLDKLTEIQSIKKVR